MSNRNLPDDPHDVKATSDRNFVELVGIVGAEPLLKTRRGLRIVRLLVRTGAEWHEVEARNVGVTRLLERFDRVRVRGSLETVGYWSKKSERRFRTLVISTKIELGLGGNWVDDATIERVVGRISSNDKGSVAS